MKNKFLFHLTRFQLILFLTKIKNFSVKSSQQRVKTFVTKVLRLMVCQGSKLWSCCCCCFCCCFCFYYRFCGRSIRGSSSSSSRACCLGTPLVNFCRKSFYSLRRTVGTKVLQLCPKKRLRAADQYYVHNHENGSCRHRHNNEAKSDHRCDSRNDDCESRSQMNLQQLQ